MDDSILVKLIKESAIKITFRVINTRIHFYVDILFLCDIYEFYICVVFSSKNIKAREFLNISWPGFGKWD